MRFAKRTITVKLRDPDRDFGEADRVVEFRWDPLTGRKCRINIERAHRPHQTGRATKALAHSRSCPFCSPNLERVTPKYSTGMPDRIRRGNAVTFPNLYPFDEFHSVATLPRFFTHPGEISVGDMVECLLACFETFKKASQRHPSLKYWILSWNHLPPAGASILHPHLQLVAAREPTRLLQEELQKSRSYYGRTGKIYWQELIRAEKDLGERYIGATGEFHWIASFAPIGNKEVMGLAEHASSLAEAEHAVKDLCQGLHKILRGFSRAGVESFNMSSYSGPLHKKANYFRLHFRIIARPPVAEVYTNDRGFMEVMHGEAVIDTLPEIWAAELRKFF